VGASLVAVRVRVFFTPVEDVSIPGFSVRFVKSSLIMADEVGLLKSLLLGGGANKPVGITPVMLGSTPLLKVGEVILRRGVRYWVRVGVVGGEDLATYLPNIVLKAFSTGVLEGGGVEVEAESLSVPPKEQPARIVIRTVTPAIIRVRSVDGKPVTVTSPTLKELLATPIRVLGRILWETQGINIPTAWAWRISRHYTQLRARTRKVGVVMKPNQPPTPAITGEWEYVATAKLPTYLKATLHKALTIAKTTGIGKSRGIGFGQTEIKTTANPKHNPPQQNPQ